jgi:rhamnosyltransferase
MHILWVLQTEQLPELLELIEALPNDQHSLLYNPNLKFEPQSLKSFTQAYPYVNPELQIRDINPDVVIAYPKTLDEVKSILQNILPKPREPTNNNTIHHVGILIRSKNNEDVIFQTLKALQSQKLCTYDLTVIDSGSTDRTLDMVKEMNAKILTVPSDDYFPGKVLNKGIQTLNTNIVVLLNADAVPLTPYTLYQLLRPFQSSSVVATFARQLPRPEALSWVRRDYNNAFPGSGKNPDWQSFSNCLSALRKEIWSKRPFYTLAWGSEDAEWGTWAKNNGYQISYTPKALVMHSHNYTLKQLYGRRFIEGEADAFIYKKQYTLPTMLLEWFKFNVSDFLFCLSRGDISGLFANPVRRWVYFWGYYKGSKLGHKRLNDNNLEPTIGQKTVLSRHDSIKSK